jgi:hypothetical protein
MLGHRLDVTAESRQRPVARRVGIGHRLKRGESLRGDDEECLGRIEITDRLGEVGAVDIGDEPERQLPVGHVPQRLVRHHRPKIGAPDADVDDRADWPAGIAFPGAAADLPAECRHPAQYLVHVGHDIMAVAEDLLSLRGAEGHVEHRAVFGGVDFFTGEHRVDPLP